jgi:hypothetical protein
MNNLDKRILESGFPDVKAVDRKRYDKDDILKVLDFMFTTVHSFSAKW